MCETYQCQQLHCHWTIPHTISGFDILKYNINVTTAENGLAIAHAILTNTLQYGIININTRISYIVSVFAVTGTVDLPIEGEVDSFQTGVNTGKLHYCIYGNNDIC